MQPYMMRKWPLKRCVFVISVINFDTCNNSDCHNLVEDTKHTVDIKTSCRIIAHPNYKVFSLLT